MDLTGMTREDAAEVAQLLTALVAAGERLADFGHVAEISVTPAAAVLRVPVRLRAGGAVEPAPVSVVYVKRSDDGGLRWPSEVAVAIWNALSPAADDGADPGPVVIDEEPARGAFPGGAQDLPATQPGMTAPAARGAEDDTGQSSEPAPAAGESGGAAAEVCDPLPASPVAEPSAAVTGTAAAVEAPPLPDRPTPVGQGAGAGAGPMAKHGQPWTPDEDERVVARVAELVHGGVSRDRAAASVAVELGRGVPSTQRRVHMALRARILAALDALAAEPSEAPEVPAAPAAPEPAPAVVVAPPEIPPVAAPEPRARAPRQVMPGHLQGDHRRIWECLDGLRPDTRFDAATDLALYEAWDLGKGVNELALTLGLDGRALMDRARDLLSSICDSKGKPRPELRMKLAAVLRWRAEAFRAGQAA
jgi:hypothetical protein